MGWNYRVMRSEGAGDALYQIHEIHYGAAGEVSGWTEAPARVSADTRDELLNVLAMMIEGLGYPVLDSETGAAIEPKRELSDAIRAALRASADYFETDDGRFARIDPSKASQAPVASDGEAAEAAADNATSPNPHHTPTTEEGR